MLVSPKVKRVFVGCRPPLSYCTKKHNNILLSVGKCNVGVYFSDAGSLASALMGLDETMTLNLIC